MRPPRKLKFTREGKFFVGITLGVGFAAINTGNNLLYLLLGMLLALIVVSGADERALACATSPSCAACRCARRSGGRTSSRSRSSTTRGASPRTRSRSRTCAPGSPPTSAASSSRSARSSAQVAAYRRTPAKRGRDRHVGFRIATRFPFGLFEKSREVPAEGELIIYPGGRSGAAPADEPPGGAPAATPSFGRGHGDDYLGLKLLRDGEDPRDIHWRKSAAVGQLVLRERAREARPDVVAPARRRPARRRDGRVGRTRSSGASATSPRARSRTSSAATRVDDHDDRRRRASAPTERPAPTRSSASSRSSSRSLAARVARRRARRRARADARRGAAPTSRPTRRRRRE